MYTEGVEAKLGMPKLHALTRGSMGSEHMPSAGEDTLLARSPGATQMNDPRHARLPQEEDGEPVDSVTQSSRNRSGCAARNRTGEATAANPTRVQGERLSLHEREKELRLRHGGEVTRAIRTKEST